MKNKILIPLVILFALSFTNNKLFSQCIGSLPSTSDLIALPTGTSGGCSTGTFISSTSNTGTDVYNDGVKDCQVIVWDGVKASLAWQYASFSGSFLFSSLAPLGGSDLTDPDVVVGATGGGTVYAMIVGEVVSGANAGKIFWASFKWTGSAFGPINASGFLGDVVTNGVCKNPNIDVNSCGRVAIAWSQKNNYNITLTTSGAPAGLNFGPVTLNVLRSDIYMAQGFVDGLSCTGSGVVSGVATASGDKVSQPTAADHLFESNISPDVCISDPGTTCAGGKFVVSIAYINQWFNPATFSITGQVVARQFKGDFCVSNLPSDIVFFNCNGYTAGKPRIASRPGGLFTADFQIVMADPSLSCNAGGPPCQLYNTKIYNWGRHNGTASPVSPAAPNVLNMTPVNFCNLNTYYNAEAVVSYRALPISTTGDFVVAWTSGPGGIANVVGNDIVARTFNQGNANLAATGSTQFSIVNRGCNGLTGNQSLASVAGRYSKFVGYAFWDNASVAGKPYIGYKLSDKNPGSTTALRMIENMVPTEVGPGETFSAQPNPFTDEVSFKVVLNAGNKASQIEISDANGRVVKNISVTSSKSMISWKPGTTAGPGIYYARLNTSNGTMVTQIVKTK